MQHNVFAKLHISCLHDNPLKIGVNEACTENSEINLKPLVFLPSDKYNVAPEDCLCVVHKELEIKLSTGHTISL